MAHCIAPMCEKDHVHEIEGKPLCQVHYDMVKLIEDEVDKYCKIPLEDLVDDEGKEVITLSAAQNLHKRVIARRAELKAFVEAGKHTEAKKAKAKGKGKKKMANDKVVDAVGYDDNGEDKTIVQKGVAVAKHYASEGSVRIVARQLVAQTRPLIVDLLTKQFGKKDRNFGSKLSMMMETPLGQAFHGIILSFLLNALPAKIKDKAPYLARVVEELRVAAVADAGNMVADMVVGPMMDLARMYFDNAEEIAEGSVGILTDLGTPTEKEVVVETVTAAPKQAAA